MIGTLKVLPSKVIEEYNLACFFSPSVNSKLPVETDLTLEQIGGSQHVVLKNTKATVTPTRVYMHLTNLFNGDKLLGKAIQATAPVLVETLTHGNA
jgi:hypothetical protein